ncbi:hypothetical protein [Clostridium sp. ZS2-4]|uniref:hypothetical protein n=1 Tax=Clostridium sp. ZS2-4 TaxID=2987703 RepID=UPI00227B9180|nr:hypothetical protein [Clostridium sp. ZS2-4]MCY6356347.1 hypothetical protein [Clostridium sp. ZS2-4]
MDYFKKCYNKSENISDSLVDYLSNGEGVSMKGTPSSFILRNVGVSMLNFNIAI